MQKKTLFTIGIAIIFILVRCIHLDADLPPFRLMSFSGIDEFYYALSGFNLLHYNSFVSDAIPLTDFDATPLTLLLNFFQAITFKVFGNNYYGLRLGSVLCSFALFLFLIDCVKRTSGFWNGEISDPKKNISIYLILLLLLFFSIEYSFLIESRVSEPGIARSFILVVLIWFVTFNDRTIKEKMLLFSFVFGFLAFFSVCFGYLYNLFYVGAAGLSLILISFKNGKSIREVIINVLLFVFGGLVCCVFYEGFIRLFFHKSLIDYLGTLAHVGNTRVSANNHSVMGVFLKIKQLFIINFGSRIFDLNLAFLLLTLLMLPLYFYRTIKSKSNFDIFISCIVVFWLSQSYFENSYPIKRHTIMFPVFILILIYSFEEVVGFVNYLKTQKLKKIVYVFYVMLVLSLVYVVANNLFQTTDTDLLFKTINITSCVIVFFVILTAVYLKKTDAKLFVLVSFILMLPACYLLFNKIMSNPTYKYKEAMVDIGKRVGDNVMVGGVSYGFRLYNNTKPVLNLYMYQYHNKSGLKKRVIKFFNSANYCVMIPDRKTNNSIEKVSPMEVGYLKEIFEETNYKFKIEKVYNIGDRYVLLMKKII